MSVSRLASVLASRAFGRKRPSAFSTSLSTALLAGFLGLGVSACDSGPTGPDADSADALLASVVAENLEALPSMEQLHLVTVDALVGASGLDPATVEVLVSTGILAAEAGDLRRGPGAESSGDALDAQWAELTGAVLGLAQTGTVLNAMDAALVKVEAAMETADDAGPSGALGAQARRARLEAAREARRRLAAAGAALAQGNAAAALAEVAKGGDAVQGLVPAERAAAFVATAQALLARAEELAGSRPSPELAALLDEAGDRCRAAQAALDAGDIREAVRVARSCAHTARVVIARLSGGVSGDQLAERAEAMVQQAASLYERAVEKVGPNPGDATAAALAQARSLLDDAASALAGENYREAIRAAQASGALSRRILAGGSPGSMEGLEARARVVVGEAQILLAEAVAKAGAEPSGGVRLLLQRANGLVEQAEAALAAGNWRRALVHGLEAMTQLRRALAMLSR